MRTIKGRTRPWEWESMQMEKIVGPTKKYKTKPSPTVQEGEERDAHWVAKRHRQIWRDGPKIESFLVEHLLSGINILYNSENMAIPLLPRLKVSQIENYDRTSDPIEHLENFKTHITFHGYATEVACKAFPLTLKRVARGWFNML